MKKPMPWMGKESKKEEMMEKKKAGSKAAYAKGEKKELKMAPKAHGKMGHKGKKK
jgi:hypothetical protein